MERCDSNGDTMPLRCKGGEMAENLIMNQLESVSNFQQRL